MAFYLVSAVPKHGLMEELSQRLARDEFVGLRPFGPTLSRALKGARLRRDGVAVWEEEDYCRPPLAEERAAVLDDYTRSPRRAGERGGRLDKDRGSAAPLPRVRGVMKAIWRRRKARLHTAQ